MQMVMHLVKSSWMLHESCNKRRVAPIAALLSAVIHRDIFSDLEMHESSEGQKGPLKWVSSYWIFVCFFIML
jgi:tRNA guanosine-2'-O-methyltransferase